MREFVIVGRPNSGKTLLALNFAKYVGCKTIDITFLSPDGLLNTRHLYIDEARRELCGPNLHKTRCLQTAVLAIPIGKTKASIKLTDSCGVTDEIHPDPDVRKAMCQTLAQIRKADCIIHIIDGAAMADSKPSMSDIDRELYNYGTARQNYIIFVNKIDLPAGRQNYLIARELYPLAPMLPISALNSEGFKEVKAYVARNY